MFRKRVNELEQFVLLLREKCTCGAGAGNSKKTQKKNIEKI